MQMFSVLLLCCEFGAFGPPPPQKKIHIIIIPKYPPTFSEGGRMLIITMCRVMWMGVRERRG